MNLNKTIANFIIKKVKPKIDKFNHSSNLKFSFKSKKKNIIDPVTKLDKKIDREILRLIKKKFPDHSCYSEENRKKNFKKHLNWIIDPVDGTKSLILGLPTWSNLIGFNIGNEPKVGSQISRSSKCIIILMEIIHSK